MVKASISESILDLKRGLSRRKKEFPFRITLFSDEKVETFFLELWQPFSFMKQDTENDIHSTFWPQCVPTIVIHICDYINPSQLLPNNAFSAWQIALLKWCVIIFTWSNFFSMNWFRVHYWTWKVKVQLSAHFRAVWVIQHWSDVRVAINQLSQWASSLPFTYTQLCMGETSAINQILPLWLGRKWLIMQYLIYCFWHSFDLEVKHTIKNNSSHYT